jgi:OmpA-OmpF porin, OOP family
MIWMRQLWGSGAILACVLALPAVARAQASPPFDSAIDVQLFDYSIGPRAFFSVDSADIADKKQLTFDAVVTFLTNPFTVYTTDGANDPMITGVRTEVVKSLTAAQLTAAYGITDKIQLGANLPLVFSLTGDGLNPTTGMGTGGVQVTGTGDLLVEAKMRLFENQGFRVAGIGGVTLPTSIGSDDSQFIGDNLPTLRGRVAATYAQGRFSVGANLGFILRKPRTIYASTIGQQMTFGVGAAVAATEKFSIIGEVYGRGGLASGFALDESPIEALGGIRLIAARSLAVTVGGGAGLDRAIGAPDARFFLSVGYAPDVRDSDGDGIPNSRDKCPLVPEDKDGFEDEDDCPDDDNDGDRRPDHEDKCPDHAEDFDGFEDEDGCPEYDNDGDGIPDLEDKCPNHAEDGLEPHPNDGCPATMRDSDGDGIPDAYDACPLEEEDFDGFEDGDGCPELDNDGDGIPDAADKCPLCPEDKDGFEDEDGCPELDNDKDGIPDAVDKCPNQPETFNGFQDEDGCPDTGGVELVKLDGDRLVIGKVPTMDRKGLTKAGDQLVTQVAAVMRARSEVTKWLVALSQPKAADATRLAGLIKARFTALGITNAEVIGAAGPAKIGGVVQERADPDQAPACPAGLEVKPRPEAVEPKGTMGGKPLPKPEPPAP